MIQTKNVIRRMHLTVAQKSVFERFGFLVYGRLLTHQAPVPLMPEELAPVRTWVDALASGSTPEAQGIVGRLEAEAPRRGLEQLDEGDGAWQLTGASRYVPE